jgi:hypothetical protein
MFPFFIILDCWLFCWVGKIIWPIRDYLLSPSALQDCFKGIEVFDIQ